MECVRSNVMTVFQHQLGLIQWIGSGWLEIWNNEVTMKIGTYEITKFIFVCNTAKHANKNFLPISSRFRYGGLSWSIQKIEEFSFKPPYISFCLLWKWFLIKVPEYKLININIRMNEFKNCLQCNTMGIYRKTWPSKGILALMTTNAFKIAAIMAKTEE